MQDILVFSWSSILSSAWTGNETNSLECVSALQKLHVDILTAYSWSPIKYNGFLQWFYQIDSCRSRRSTADRLRYTPPSRLDRTHSSDGCWPVCVNRHWRHNDSKDYYPSEDFKTDVEWRFHVRSAQRTKYRAHSVSRCRHSTWRVCR